MSRFIISDILDFDEGQIKIQKQYDFLKKVRWKKYTIFQEPISLIQN